MASVPHDTAGKPVVDRLGDVVRVSLPLEGSTMEWRHAFDRVAAEATPPVTAIAWGRDDANATIVLRIAVSDTVPTEGEILKALTRVIEELIPEATSRVSNRASVESAVRSAAGVWWQRRNAHPNH